MAYANSSILKTPTVLEQLLEEINFQRTKEMRQLLKDDSGFVMLQGTTYWTDLFVRHFLFQNEQTIDCDDLLFFVRKKHVKGTSRYLPKFETEVDVFRKDSRKLPIGDPDIDWEETVYLNLIIHQFDYTLTLAICTRTSPKELQVLKRHSQKVYASPSRRKMDTKGEGEEMTYPHICFMVDNFDEVFCDILVRDGEMVCVELVASDRQGAIQGVIFLGSIRYDALKKVYDARQSSLSTKMAQRMTFGLFSGSTAQRCEFVRMKGPQGKGHAEMAVTKPKGSGVETPTSEPGFCATDMWDSDWDEDPEDFYVYRSQRRLSDPSANLNNFVRGGWKTKIDAAKSRSENEGLDCMENGVSEIEAGDLRDDNDGLNGARPASSSRSRNGCCGCWRPVSTCKRGDSISLMSEMYCRSAPTRSTFNFSCAEKAPIGPLDTQCPCINKSARHKFVSSILNQSEYEVADDATSLKCPDISSTKLLTENANFTEFEFADDAISLNDELSDERPSSRNSMCSLKNDNPTFINVNGKEELPSPEQNIQNGSVHVKYLNKTKRSRSVKITKTDCELSNKHIVVEKEINNVENKLNHLDDNRNTLSIPSVKTYSTLPKRKRDSVNHRMWYRPVLEPPHRVTPDGTDIYYWCDMPKRMGQELDDGQYNPLWTMRGFTQTFHFWKESKRAQSVPLNAFLTYITLPWWSIAKDILDHREGPILTF